MLAVKFILHQQDEDEDEDRRHDDPTDDDYHGAAEELVVDGAAVAELTLSGEGHATDQTCTGEGRDAVIVDGQDAELVVPWRGKIAQNEQLMGGGNHPERERKGDTLIIKKLNKYSIKLFLLLLTNAAFNW